MKKNLFLGQKSTLAFKTLTTNNVCTETIIEWNWCRKHIWENPTFTHENSLYNLGINGNLVDREYLLKIQWHCNRRSSYSDRMNVSLKITSKARLSFSTLKTVCVCMLSCLSFVQLFALLWTVAPPQAPLSMVFLQARILQWVAMSSSRGIFPIQWSNPSLLWLLHCSQILYQWAPRETLIQEC